RARLGDLKHGSLSLREGDGYEVFGRPESGESAEIEVVDPRFFRCLALGGTLGAARSFMNGWWVSKDLPAVIQLFVRNIEVSDGLESRSSRWLGFAAKGFHRLRRNTRKGSRKNIQAHYDLSNEFFALFLDPTMTYSCGIFESAGATMQEASIAKIDRICRKLELGADDHLLEIGTGWGSMAIHAAAHYGCRVTTTTISREQAVLARARIAEAGLTDRVEVVLEDYRDLSGTYDKLVSIEMIEAVGHEYYDAYFGACSRLLAPDGMMLLQAITIADQRYDQLRRSVDFIQRYVFPGSLLPSIREMAASVTRATNLRVFHLEDITPHYATTLQRWRAKFHSALGEVRRLGYSEEFIRMWDYYLSYCEGAFAERYIGDVQIVLTKPQCRRDPILAPLPRSTTSSS
ncbi:MAG: class I SAM-dependent methyltransferase, partial [Planctomycetes bacterium]|nr:class I SAM-dependent methyltransferase [Planctomycetota bacterium]